MLCTTPLAGVCHLEGSHPDVWQRVSITVINSRCMSVLVVPGEIEPGTGWAPGPRGPCGLCCVTDCVMAIDCVHAQVQPSHLLALRPHQVEVWA